MTSEVTVKTAKSVEPKKRRYVNYNDVPDLISRVMQNDLYISDLAAKDAKIQTSANS